MKKESEMEEPDQGKVLEEDLKKVQADALKKAQRHRVDEYVAIVIGVGAVLICWILQAIGLY